MRLVLVIFVILVSMAAGFAQGPARQIYDTERAFEKAVADRGIRVGFLEFLAEDAVMFFPEPANARDTYTKRASTPSALTWNPILVGVSSNGALGYSIGNSIFRPKGKDDPAQYSGHYLSVWMRQSDGQYRAVLDAGINHEKPASVATEWKDVSPAAEVKTKHAGAANSSVDFFLTAEAEGLEKAYRAFLAEDAIVLRDEKQPFAGKKAALHFFKSDKAAVKFSKRKSFIETAELAYAYGPYSRVSKEGSEIEKGSFIQIWRLRGGKWQIVADLSVVIPNPQK